MVIAFAGAGLSSAVLVHQLAKTTNHRFVLFDKRDHLAGNCHSDRDSGIMIHKYGPHIFHTSDREVWDFMNSFCDMRVNLARARATVKDRVYSFPINLETINKVTGYDLSPQAAKNYLQPKQIEAKNFEEHAIARFGRKFYELFIKGYTEKQWGEDPRNLPASIIKRIPIRFDYNDSSTESIYQGIPEEGYTEIVKKMLNHRQIEIRLKTEFTRDMENQFERIFYSGPIDAYYDYCFGRLGYRTVEFERHETIGDYQGCAMMNFPDKNIPWTRITEHKHFTPWEKHEHTIYFKEFSKETGPKDVPFYPKRLKEDLEKLTKYQLISNPKVTFIGRLGTYRYLDMHIVIKESLELAKKLKL